MKLAADKIVMLLGAIFIAAAAPAPAALSQDAELVDVIPEPKSEDALLEEAAEREEIPQDERLYYKSRMKDLNRAYENGLFTKTEYVQRKRELIDLCK